MTDLSAKLSAYLDSELDPSEAREIEARLATDLEAQAELDLLIQADAVAQAHFEDQLTDPVPLALVQQIKSAEMPVFPAQVQPTRRRPPVWMAIAASFVALFMGGAGGYILRDQTAPVPQTGWLVDIANYHEVYAGQERHLVEVRANESDHIENWLGNTVGTAFSIPDLSEYGLQFEGGRLLVANAKPVAQLMYRLPDGTVIALCLQRSSKDPVETVEFNQVTMNNFDLVSWTADGSDFVVVGPSGQPDLPAIAMHASETI
ncbi:MAG: anti-sigma factor [Pseudomonadota bacterium]